MANNKIQLADGSVLIDLTQDTVSPNVLKSGYTAHDASGNAIVGAMESTGTGLLITGEINQNGSKTTHMNGVANESAIMDSHGGTILNIAAVILLDLSNDTVSPEVLKSGYTAHDASGQLITGILLET